MPDAVETGNGEAEAIFQRGLTLHREEQFAPAAVLYQRTLQLDPGHFQAYHFLGVLALQCNQPAQAVGWITRALRENPHSAAAHSNLGNAQLQLGLHDAALASCDRALADDPQLRDALYNRGNVLSELQRFAEAIASYDQVIALGPSALPAYNNRGLALAAIGRSAAAIASYDAGIAIDPCSAVLWNNRGNALHQCGQYVAAIESFDRAIALNSLYADPYANRAHALSRLERHEAALASCDQALALDPGSAEAHTNRGNALRGLQRLAEALESHERVIAIRPDCADAHNNRGIVLRDLGELRAAIASYDRAIALKPDHSEAHSNRGIALHDLRELDEAIASFTRAIEHQPNFAEAHLNRAMSRLLAGNFAQGWRDYEWRWNTPALAAGKREFDRPLWLGHESLLGKTILIHGEQGFGDMLQFSRYASLIAGLGASVILQVPTPLTRLLSSLQGVQCVLRCGEPLPSFDYHCPLMSLPLALNTTAETIPAVVPYLCSDRAKVALWKERLGKRDRPRVGLVWAGGEREQADWGLRNRRRNIPLEDLAPLQDAEVDFYSLQKGQSASEQTQLTENWQRRRPIDFTSLLADFSDTAALVQSLDLVISVDTSVAHLAGALAKPVWIMHSFDACWRWLLERTDSPWYPTARLYRQERPGDWAPVIERIRSDLCQLAR